VRGVRTAPSTRSDAVLPRPDDALPLEYVLPLRWGGDVDPADALELADYLERLAAWLPVTVVDGSESEVWARQHALFVPHVRHVAPEPWPGRNGKVAGVVTGVRLAREELVVVADDDVRWDRPGLERLVGLMAGCALVRPQNVFVELPWHARWDTARSLLNRSVGADYPGTYGVRRSTFLAAGGYDGDVLFENLEMSRTLRAAGGRERSVPDLYVGRLPPTAAHFLGQRVRQAYDDLAQPVRLVAEAALAPAVLVLAVLACRASTRRSGRAGLALLLTASVGLAEVGRRRAGGAGVYPRTAALWAPLWLAERAVCVWLALGHRARGGVPYGGQRIRLAAHSVRRLRSRAPRLR
jgi:glycosyl transferase family 21